MMRIGSDLVWTAVVPLLMLLLSILQVISPAGDGTNQAVESSKRDATSTAYASSHHSMPPAAVMQGPQTAPPAKAF
jgi:hypothetical protein